MKPQISDWQFCGAPGVSCLSQSSQQEVGQFLDLALSIRSQAEEPEEVDDDQRTQANKPAICVDPNDPTEEEDDCPSIYNMGGNSEMLLNRGVGITVDLISFSPCKYFCREKEIAIHPGVRSCRLCSSEGWVLE